MTIVSPLSGVSDRVGDEVRRWRRWHGWTVDELAVRCDEAGGPHLTRPALNNLESGRRDGERRRRMVSVDELLLLANVLDVSPGRLLVPVDVDPGEPYSLTPRLAMQAGEVRAWLGGAARHEVNHFR